MTSIAYRFRFSVRSDVLLGHPIICDKILNPTGVAKTKPGKTVDRHALTLPCR